MMKPEFLSNGTLSSHNSRAPADRADDIGDLFRQFGADPAGYQEIGQDNRAIAAQLRWPLLGRLRIGKVASAPVAPPVAAQVSVEPVNVVTPITGASQKATNAKSLSQLFRRLATEAPEPLPRASKGFGREKF